MKKHHNTSSLRNSYSESQLFNASQGSHGPSFGPHIQSRQYISPHYTMPTYSDESESGSEIWERSDRFHHRHLNPNLKVHSEYEVTVHEPDRRELQYRNERDDYSRKSRSMADFLDYDYDSFENRNYFDKEERTFNSERYEEGKYDFDDQSLKHNIRRRNETKMHRNDKPYVQGPFIKEDHNGTIFEREAFEMDDFHSVNRNFNSASENSLSKLVHNDVLEKNYRGNQERIRKTNFSKCERDIEMQSYDDKSFGETEHSRKKMNMPQKQRTCTPHSSHDVTDDAHSFVKIDLKTSHEHNELKLENKLIQMENKYQSRKSLTMRDARGIAKDLGVLRDIDAALDNSEEVKTSDDLQDENFTDNDSNKPNTHRKCWARMCWSEDKHSHVLRPGKCFYSEDNKWSKFQKKGISANDMMAKWENQQQMVEMKMKKVYEDIFLKWSLWSGSLKVIEGRYGTGVTSFFIFLRWLLFLNLFIFVIVLIFVIIPQSLILSSEKQTKNEDVPSSLHKSSVSFTPEIDVLPFDSLNGLYNKLANRNASEEINHNNVTNRKDISDICYKNYSQLVKNSLKTNFDSVQDFIQGTGWLELTLMFTGFYTPDASEAFSRKLTYNMAVAFLLVTLSYFLCCLIMIIKYANAGIREMLESEGFGNKYCNMIFTGWDFCIEARQTAKLKQCSIMQELKSQIAEERFKANKAGWSTRKKITVFIIRLISNLSVLGMLIGAFFLIKFVVQESLKSEKKSASGSFLSLLLQYLPSITIAALNFILPLIFTQVVRFEKYSKEFEIQITLSRMVFVRLASIGILVYSFYKLISCNTDELDNCSEGDGSNCKRPLCWETYVGQQMYKLVMMDFFLAITITIFIETPRRIFVSKSQSKLAKMIGQQEFDIPSQVLAMVYSQALCWLGTFYCPMLPAICVLNLIIFFYAKKFTLLKNCAPSSIPYRASRSNTFFMAALMLTFLATIIVLGYSVSEIPPSVGCGPFRYYDHMISPIREAVSRWPSSYQSIISVLFSTVFAVPVFGILCMVIFYYITLASANYKMTEILKEQLLLNSKDKQFLLANLNDVTH